MASVHRPALILVGVVLAATGCSSSDAGGESASRTSFAPAAGTVPANGPPDVVGMHLGKALRTLRVAGFAWRVRAALQPRDANLGRVVVQCRPSGGPNGKHRISVIYASTGNTVLSMRSATPADLECASRWAH